MAQIQCSATHVCPAHVLPFRSIGITIFSRSTPPHLHTSPNPSSGGCADHDADEFYWDVADERGGVPGHRGRLRRRVGQAACPRHRRRRRPTHGPNSRRCYLAVMDPSQGRAPLFLFPISPFFQNSEPKDTDPPTLRLVMEIASLHQY